LITWC